MADKKHFFTPKLTGERFNGHTIPIDVLEDFTAFQEMFTELAKKMYLEDNPTRQRVPRGFTEGVSLSLESISEGSTILNFILTTNLIASTILGINTDSYTYFERAKNKIIEVIIAADENEKISPLLSSEFAKYFQRIGRSLKEDESILISTKDPNKFAKINKQVRTKLIKGLGDHSNYIDSFDFTALISSVDKIDKSFTIMVENAKLVAKIDPRFYKTIIKTFTDYNSQTYVNIKGEGIYSNNDKLIKIESVKGIEVLDPLDISVRLNELSKLKDGWYHSEGKGLSEKQVIIFEKLFKKNYPNTLPLPAIFPTVDGNLQLEWSTGEIETSLEVNLKTFKANLMSVDTWSEVVKEDQLDLTKQEDWAELSKLLM